MICLWYEDGPLWVPEEEAQVGRLLQAEDNLPPYMPRTQPAALGHRGASFHWHIALYSPYGNIVT